MIESSVDFQAALTRFSPYFQEIRRRVLTVLIMFVIGAALGFIYFEPIIRVILKFYNLQGLNVVFTSPFQFVNLSINSGFVVGFIFAFPFLLFQSVQFLKPALKPKEYQLLISSIPMSIVLFIAGFSFGIWIMKFVVTIFSQQSTELNVQNLWDIENFLASIFTTSLFLGLFFQFPIVITTLMKLNITSIAKVVKLRIPIYVVLLLFTIMLPPTDLLSNALIFLPLVFLFEVTVLFNRSNISTVKA